MLLRSDIATTLLERGCRLVVCSPNVDEPYFRDEFTHPQIVLENMPTRTSRWEDRLSTWRQYLLMNPSLGATLNYKRESLRYEKPARYYVTRAANTLLGNIPLLRRMYMRLESRLYPAHEFDGLLERHHPDLVVTGTPGFNVHDVHLLRAAARIGIPTSTVMLSWDNLTSKGYMNGVPDSLLVWSELMADEAQEYHDYPRDRIHWTGAAQFDVYHQARARIDRCQWRRQNDVPEDAFLMMYGTINPGICPHELSIVQAVIEAMRSANMPRKPFLWVRLHPQVVNGPWRRTLKPFQDLAAPDVRIEVPPVHDGGLNWDLPKADAEHLMSLLASADLCVMICSTLSIDAACADTPIANVFFDGIEVPAAAQVARFQKYTHYAKILATGGIAIAATPAEFQQIMRRYAEQPRLDAVERQAIVRQQLGRLDGMAGRRTAEKLVELAGHGLPAGK